MLEVVDRDLVRVESKHFRDMYGRLEMWARLPETEVQLLSHQVKAARDHFDFPKKQPQHPEQYSEFQINLSETQLHA